MQDYAQAILANANNNNLAPTASPIVPDAARLGAISGANASKFARALTDTTAAAAGGMAGNQADLAATSIQGEIQKSKQRQQEIADSIDPSKYQQVENANGGYDFIDPKGQKITVDQYARVTGKNRAALLKDSSDPSDVQFRNDYNNLQDLLQATLDKDKTKLDEYYKNQPELKGMKPADLINRFKTFYKGYFGGQAQSYGAPQFTSLDAAAGNNAGLSDGGDSFN